MSAERRSGRRTVLLATTLALAVSGCGDGTGSGAPAPTDFDLVFYSDRSGNGDLYLIPGEGFAKGAFEPRRLVGTPAPDFNPRWVPEGPGLVFISEVEDPPALYGLAPEAEGMSIRLGVNPAMGEPPAFTPDGSRMVYAGPSDAGIDLFIRDLGGGEAVRLTMDGGRKVQPAVSPDGEWIVYGTGLDGAQDLALLRIDGSEGRFLTRGGDNDGHPSWLPDGGGLLFDSNRVGVGTDIFHLDLETGNLRNLTNDPGIDLVATASPDGEWVAFGSSRNGNWDLYVMPFQGGTVRRVTATPTFEGDPRWVPAGLFVVPEGPGGD